jgi:hypothetical protein
MVKCTKMKREKLLSEHPAQKNTFCGSTKVRISIYFQMFFYILSSNQNTTEMVIFSYTSQKSCLENLSNGYILGRAKLVGFELLRVKSKT